MVNVFLMVVVVLSKKKLIYRKENTMYYIYDNYHEEWYGTAFAEFEDAEREMFYLIEKRKSKEGDHLGKWVE